MKQQSWHGHPRPLGWLHYALTSDVYILLQGFRSKSQLGSVSGRLFCFFGTTRQQSSEFIRLFTTRFAAIRKPWKPFECSTDTRYFAKTQRLGILSGMSFVRVVVLLSLTYADAVRPMAAETDVDLGNQSYPDCLGNLGKCCTVKCNGKHKWVGKTVLTFSDCQRQLGAFINPRTKTPMRSSLAN